MFCSWTVLFAMAVTPQAVLKCECIGSFTIALAATRWTRGVFLIQLVQGKDGTGQRWYYAD